LAEQLVGDGVLVPCVDGVNRPYLGLDAAASTGALPAVAARVEEFLPWYSSVHRGAGYKSQVSTAAYEEARQRALAFAGRDGPTQNGDDVAIICRNTTEAINHLAYRLRLSSTDVVVTTVVEHHANLLPWGRVATRRFVECGPDGTFTTEDVAAALDVAPKPALLAVTGASNVTGWLPPIDDIIAAAHDRDVPVVVDAAQLAPHRPLPRSADFMAWSGHKMYSPFGAGVLLGRRESFLEGDPFLAGGGAVELVDLDEVVWSDPPEREEAGSPNVIGAVALSAAMEQLSSIGWPAIIAHENLLRTKLRDGLAAIDGVKPLGPGLDVPGLPVTSFVVDGVSHALVAARLSAEYGIGVRHGCFCAHPYLVRLLDLSQEELNRFRDDARQGRRKSLPGAVRASACLSTTVEDIDRLLEAVSSIASGSTAPVDYVQDPLTGDWWPDGFAQVYTDERRTGGGCARS
jgi:selenocysteine lyase/cysteine desulfurase